MKEQEILSKPEAEAIEREIQNLILYGADNCPKTIQRIDELHDLYTRAYHSKREQGKGWRIIKNERS